MVTVYRGMIEVFDTPSYRQEQTYYHIFAVMTWGDGRPENFTWVWGVCFALLVYISMMKIADGLSVQ